MRYIVDAPTQSRRQYGLYDSDEKTQRANDGILVMPFRDVDIRHRERTCGERRVACNGSTFTVQYDDVGESDRK